MKIPRPARLLDHPSLSSGALLGLCSLLPVLLGQRYAGLDLSRYLLGMECALRRPDGLFDAALGGGSPLIGEPFGGVFYPPNLLLLPFSAELATSLYVVVHLVAAAAASSYLGRSVGLRPRAALALGVAFGACGTVANLVLHANYLSGAAWLPLAWGGAANLARRPGRSAALALASGIALLLLGCDFQMTGVAIGLSILELSLLLRWRGPARRKVAAGLGAAAVAAGLLVGALQAAPAFALKSGAQRSKPLDAAQREQLPIGPAQALAIVWPGAASARSDVGVTLTEALADGLPAMPPWNDSPYLGLLAVVAAMTSLTRRRRRFAVVGLLAAATSLGAHTPFYRLAVAALPPLQFFRYPSKWFLVASLALLVAAACSLARAGPSPRVRQLLRNGLLIALAASLVGLAATATWAVSLDALALKASQGIFRPELRPPLSGILLGRGAWACAAGLAALLVLLRAPRWLPAVLGLDLLMAFAAGLPLADPMVDIPVPARALGGPAEAMLCHGGSIGTLRLDPADRDLGAAAPVVPVWVNLQANTNQCGGPAVPPYYLASVRSAVFALATRIEESTGAIQPALALGCTHLATRAELPAQIGLRVASIPAEPLFASIYQLRDPVPTASVAAAPFLIDNEDAVLSRIASARDAADLARLIDAPEKNAPASLPSGSRAGSVQVSWGHHGSGEVTVRGEGGAVVVLRRAWWPGYHAVQAGRELPVLRAMGAQLAIVVDDVAQGPVELRYREPGLVLGIVLALLGLALLAGVVRACSGPRHSGAPSTQGSRRIPVLRQPRTRRRR